MPLRMITTLILLLASTTARADFFLVGNNADTGLAVPFGLDSDGPADPSDRYQQVYNASVFGSAPIAIGSLSFYATPSLGNGGDFNPVTYQIYFSTTSQSVAGLSSNLDANVGADETLFATITPTGAAPSEFDISGNPFVYDPTKGNLLLDIRIVGQTSTGAFLGATFDTLTDFSGQSSSINNFGPISLSSGGLVTGFRSVPEPSSLALCGAAGLILIGHAWRIRRKSRSA